jgi:hypothetical protein
LATASAASLGLNSDRIGAGNAAITTCGNTSGASVTYGVSGGLVTSVVVANLPAGCGGGSLSVTLVGAGGTSLASPGPLVLPSTPAPGATLAIGGSVSSASVVRSDLVIVGP